MQPEHPTRTSLNQIDAELSQFEITDAYSLGRQGFLFYRAHFLPEWRKRFPGAQVHVLEEAGHYVVEDADEHILPFMAAF
jgi:haloalkane dehalogenase